MRTIFYRFTFRLILAVGIVVGMVKGQEARQKWVNKKKVKYESRLGTQKDRSQGNFPVALDEIEMSTYHS